MVSGTDNLAAIKIQTARMLEIYALLRHELGQMPADTFRPEDVAKLHQAISTVRTNMRDIQEHVVRAREASSEGSAEARELEEILTSVLAWVQEEGE
jgi:hypothetical protein